MKEANPTFWYYNIGNLVTLISILIAIAAFHFANVKRIETAAREWQEIRTKMDLMFEWFKSNIITRSKEG